MGFSEQQNDSVDAMIPEFVELLRTSTVFDENGDAFDKEIGKPLGKMFGEKVWNHPVELSVIEEYGYWIFCSCGYHRNSLESKFCGGCGHPIKLPDFLREEAESAWYPPDFIFEDNQWFKVEGNKKTALQPEINGVFDI